MVSKAEKHNITFLIWTIFPISCMTYLKYLDVNHTLTRPFLVTLTDIININCECMFDKYVFNGKLKYGLSFYSKILYHAPYIPPSFSASAADFVSVLLEKKQKVRLGVGIDGAENVKQHQFFNVSYFSIPVTI
jgi:hypothetical protein